MDLEKINQLEELCEKYAKAPWKTVDKRLEDDTQKWVMYQASLEDQEDRDERLEFIVNIMNNLPDLLKAAKQSLETSTPDVTTFVTAAQVKQMILEILLSHEKAKHH